MSAHTPYETVACKFLPAELSAESVRIFGELDELGFPIVIPNVRQSEFNLPGHGGEDFQFDKPADDPLPARRSFKIIEVCVSRL